MCFRQSILIKRPARCGEESEDKMWQDTPIRKSTASPAFTITKPSHCEWVQNQSEEGEGTKVDCIYFRPYWCCLSWSRNIVTASPCCLLSHLSPNYLFFFKKREKTVWMHLIHFAKATLFRKLFTFLQSLITHKNKEWSWLMCSKCDVQIVIFIYANGCFGRILFDNLQS